MADLSEEEALALVAVRGHCDDLDTWKLDPDNEGTWEIAAGVQDELSIRGNQFIHPHVTQSPIPGYGIRFLFTLFRKTKVEKERIYQPDLRFGSRKKKVSHLCSHEHIYLAPMSPSPFSELKEKRHARRHH